jgi:hypothetical protein
VKFMKHFRGAQAIKVCEPMTYRVNARDAINCAWKYLSQAVNYSVNTLLVISPKNIKLLSCL